MLILILILFAIAASIGLYLITYVFQKKITPKGIVFTHGPIAATALILLIIYAILYAPALWISIGLFIFAALLGLWMVFRDITGKLVPIWLASLHGLSAICGFLYLLYFTYLNW